MELNPSSLTLQTSVNPSLALSPTEKRCFEEESALRYKADTVFEFIKIFLKSKTEKNVLLNSCISPIQLKVGEPIDNIAK